MIFKTRRQSRYAKLKDSGFLPFEAYALSKVAFKTPYVRGMIAERRKKLRQAEKEGWSRIRYNALIMGHYQRKGWRRRSKDGKTVLDPWAMLRDYQDRYKSQHPEYVSPWIKKQKKFRNFASKYDRGLERYEKGRGR